MDCLLINPNSSTAAYQDLAEVYSAIEPPTWALLLAESCRSKGFDVGIFDSDAEKMSLTSSVDKVINLNPRLALFVVYGQNPNSGTTSMIGAISLAEALRDSDFKGKIAFVGSHTSALPMQVLSYNCVDLVLLNEGVYALHNLLKSNLESDLAYINGIGYKKKGPGSFQTPYLNKPEIVVPHLKWILTYLVMPGIFFPLKKNL
jgi:anaerobic magnesium-protoporphyrin IX monomethyl ester cyclase